MESLPPLVTRSPDILSGTPVFYGTRVPVKNLLDYLVAGDSIETFLDHFPTVSREQVVRFLQDATDFIATAVYENPA